MVTYRITNVNAAGGIPETEETAPPDSIAVPSAAFIEVEINPTSVASRKCMNAGAPRPSVTTTAATHWTSPAGDSRLISHMFLYTIIPPARDRDRRR
jgi:hypothetical protein